MKTAINLLILWIIFVVISFPAVANNLWEEHERGWFWYEDPIIIEEKPKPSSPKEKQSTTRKVVKPMSYSEMLQKIQKVMREIRAKALLNPTPENTAAWWIAQLIMMNLAGRFTEASLSVPVLFPELDVSSVIPQGEISSAYLNYEHRKQQDKLFKDLATKGALVFAYRKLACYLCQKEEEVLAKLKRRYGFKVFGLYEDEPPFIADRAKVLDDTIKENLNIRTLPSLYYYRKGNFYYIGSGALSTDDIKRRLLFLAQQQGWQQVFPLYVIDRKLPFLQQIEEQNVGALLEYLEKLEKQGYSQ